MPRELGDVLHYFFPESGQPAPAVETPCATLAIPLGEHDVVRAAFVWNLAVELARLGEPTAVVAARGAGGEALWPAAEIAPLGAELVLCPATCGEAFAEEAVRVALERAARDEKSRVLACLPTAWIDAARPLLGETLLFTTPDVRDGQAALALARRVLRVAPDATLGLTVHAVSGLDEASDAFCRLAAVVERDLGRELVSYGCLVDDLHVYRAIAERRPLALTRPQSRAARCLRDVARLLHEDAHLAHA